MIRRTLLRLVRFYSRAISPALPARCRFYPTCSAYAAEAIERHGAARGSWLALRRLSKCAPWHPGGVDLVPGTRSGTQRDADASSTSVPSSTADRARTPRATPADRRRVNEESSVA
jgi:uncharacterized protein